MNGIYSCQEIVELVTEYLDSGLTLDDRARFERHVVMCPPCRGYLSQMRWTIRLTGAVDETYLPQGVRDDLMRAFADWKGERPE